MHAKQTSDGNNADKSECGVKGLCSTLLHCFVVCSLHVLSRKPVLLWRIWIADIKLISINCCYEKCEVNAMFT